MIKTLNLIDARIEYSDEGEGEAVLLVHGSLSKDWFASVARLLTGYRVLLIHRAGYGNSEDLVNGVTIAGHAEHCAEVLSAAGVRRAHVAGHSAGACVALQLARSHPDLVGSLVLLEPALPRAPDEPKSAAMGSAMSAARVGEYEQAFDRFLAAVCGPDFRAVFVRELGERGLSDAIASSKYFFTTEGAAVGKWAFGPAELAEIVAPTLLVVGGEGERLQTPHRARSSHIASYVDHAQLLVLAGLSHAMPLEDPVRIAQTIVDFAASHPLRT